jgi:predicted amidophosphoribosyltransferase
MAAGKKKKMVSASRQWSWAKRKKARGRCASCGNKRNRYRWLCDPCQKKASGYMKRWRLAQKKAAEVKARMLR